VIFADERTQDASVEFVSERYAVHAIPIDETKGCFGVSVLGTAKRTE
jgi:hypothetical protein